MFASKIKKFFVLTSSLCFNLQRDKSMWIILELLTEKQAELLIVAFYMKQFRPIHLQQKTFMKKALTYETTFFLS